MCICICRYMYVWNKPTSQICLIEVNSFLYFSVEMGLISSLNFDPFIHKFTKQAYPILKF